MLSWKGFVPLSRVTYLVYLIHPVLLVLVVYSRRTLAHLNNFDMVGVPLVPSIIILFWFFKSSQSAIGLHVYQTQIDIIIISDVLLNHVTTLLLTSKKTQSKKKQPKLECFFFSFVLNTKIGILLTYVYRFMLFFTINNYILFRRTCLWAIWSSTMWPPLQQYWCLTFPSETSNVSCRRNHLTRHSKTTCT